MTDQVIATEDAIVHDDVLGIDRKVFAGQPVPPDLVDAYKGGVRSGDGATPSTTRRERRGASRSSSADRRPASRSPSRAPARTATSSRPTSSRRSRRPTPPEPRSWASSTSMS
jgi:hypothetical protein